MVYLVLCFLSALTNCVSWDKLQNYSLNPIQILGNLTSWWIFIFSLFLSLSFKQELSLLILKTSHNPIYPTLLVTCFVNFFISHLNFLFLLWILLFLMVIYILLSYTSKNFQYHDKFLFNFSNTKFAENWVNKIFMTTSLSSLAILFILET